MRTILMLVVSGCAATASAQDPSPRDADAPPTWEALRAAALASLDSKPPGIPDGYVLIGDIQYPVETFLAADAAHYGPTNYWPLNGGTGKYEVHFRFSAEGGDFTVPEGVKQAARDAHAHLESVCNVDFIELASGDTRPGQIFYRNSPITHFNNSPIGRQPVQNPVNINDWNFETLTHETMHSLGVQHEHQRPDRDTKVQVRWANVIDINEFNFVFIPGSTAVGPYDFASIMHYSGCAFSECGEACTPRSSACATIEVLNGLEYLAWQDVMGHAPTTSAGDRGVLSSLYPDLNTRFARPDGPAGLGTFFNPWNAAPIGLTQTPVNGRLRLLPGDYSAVAGTYSRAMRVDAPFGGVRLH